MELDKCKPRTQLKLILIAFSVVFAIVLYVAACAVEYDSEPVGSEFPGKHMYVWHDNKRDVTCWIFSVGSTAAMDCWPDPMIQDGGR